MPHPTKKVADHNGKPGPLAYAERMLDREGATDAAASQALAHAFEYAPLLMLEYLARNDVKFRMLPQGEKIPDYVPGLHVERTRAAYHPENKTCYIEYEHRKPGVIIHELAHAIDHTLGGKEYLSDTYFPISTRDFKKEAGKINNYATSNKQEYFAEALRLWMNVPEPEEGRWNNDKETITKPREFVRRVAPEAVRFIEEIKNRIIEEMKEEPSRLSPGTPDAPSDPEEIKRRRRLYFDELGNNPHFQKEVSGNHTIYYHEGRAALLDNGQSITMPSWGADTEHDTQTIRAGLALMSTRCATIQLNGSDDFKAQALRIAVEMGIPISNPELREDQEVLQKQFSPRQKPAPELNPRQRLPLGDMRNEDFIRKRKVDSNSQGLENGAPQKKKRKLSSNSRELGWGR